MKRPVRKPYRVRRTVDRSMRYFEAGYLAKHLLHDDDDDDDEEEVDSGSDPRSAAKSPSTPPSGQRPLSTRSPDHRRTASVRSAMRFKFDSAVNSDDVDDVTNIKRYR